MKKIIKNYKTDNGQIEFIRKTLEDAFLVNAFTCANVDWEFIKQDGSVRKMCTVVTPDSFISDYSRLLVSDTDKEALRTVTLDMVKQMLVHDTNTLITFENNL